jgi:predicted aspartyl protease
MMMRSRFLVLLLSLGFLSPSIVEARIYQYTDDSGRKVYVDRLSKVPAKYREQLSSRQEEQEDLSDEQIQELKAERNLKQLRLKINRQRIDIKDAMKEWITPFSFHANRILIPVKLVYGSRSVNLSLVMDTGASHTVVHKSALGSLNAQFSEAGAARVADGSVVKTERIKLDRVDIGPYKLKHISAGVIDYKGGGNGTQGLLGMDFLYHAQYELDKKNQQIIWAPEKYNKLKDQLVELDKLEQRLEEETAAPGDEGEQ